MKLKSSENTTRDKQGSTKIWLIPPGLQKIVCQFEEHCRLSDGQPIMIVGPTGVGKSLFLEIAKDVFQDVNKIGDRDRNVIEANCSHFGGKNSDANVSRAELFGCDEQLKNATYYVENGYIKEAHEGLLILEEIGELPEEPQAMLLTFIESGKYRKVGVGKKEYEANVVIVGATNREEALRPDLRYRFKPFYLPSLANRREDIFYYMFDKYPDVVLSLKPWEVFTLLAYNWPGNVREIDRVCFLIKREQKLRKINPGDNYSIYNSSLAFLWEAGADYCEIDLGKLLQFEEEFLTVAPDVYTQAEEALNRFGLGISLTKGEQESVFSEDIANCFSDPKLHYNSNGLSILEDGKYQLTVNKEFKRIWLYFRLFCNLFGLSGNESVDLIQLFASNEFWKNKTFRKKPLSKKQLKRCLSDSPDFHVGFDEFLESMRQFSENGDLADHYRLKRSIWSFSLEELTEIYYRGLYSLTDGDKSLAVDKSGKDRKTVISNWREYGLIP